MPIKQILRTEAATFTTTWTDFTASPNHIISFQMKAAGNLIDDHVFYACLCVTELFEASEITENNEAPEFIQWWMPRCMDWGYFQLHPNKIKAINQQYYSECGFIGRHGNIETNIAQVKTTKTWSKPSGDVTSRSEASGLVCEAEPSHFWRTSRFRPIFSSSESLAFMVCSTLKDLNWDTAWASRKIMLV